MTDQHLAITRRLLERTEAELRERRRLLTMRAYGAHGPQREMDAIVTLVDARERLRRRIQDQEAE